MALAEREERRTVVEVHRKERLEPRKIADLVDTHPAVVADTDCVKVLDHRIVLEAGRCTGLEDTDLAVELHKGAADHTDLEVDRHVDLVEGIGLAEGVGPEEADCNLRTVVAELLRNLVGVGTVPEEAVHIPL